MTESRHDGHHVPWVLPPGISQSQLGGVFKLDWLHKYVTPSYIHVHVRFFVECVYIVYVHVHLGRESPSHLMLYV